MENLCPIFRRFICSVLSMGPIPNHVAFIMDGNRRYAKRHNLREGAGVRSGFAALSRMIKYCSEMGVTHVTVYAFSIDNFKKRPEEEIRSTMRLIKRQIEWLSEEDDENILDRHGMRLNIVGNLGLLPEPLRAAAERATRATARNKRGVFSICIGYSSTDEIVRAVGECRRGVDVDDVDRRVRVGGAPDPDVIVRTSGEMRLSNFLLWQSACTLLWSAGVLWPEVGFRHLVVAVLDYQRSFQYLENKRKQIH